MTLQSAKVTIDGLPLIVMYKRDGEEVDIHQIYLAGWEILSVMDDKKISEVRRKLTNGEGKEV
jgi:hypothetical protein